jgi:acyl-CoA thioesterase I
MGQGGMPADSNANCIMPLGDSITQGDLEHLSYRYWLWKQLTDAGHTFGFVGSMRARMARMAGQTSLPFPDAKFDIDHQGHWGKTPKEILDILNGITSWDRITPGIVLMHAGTNEVWTAGNESADVIAQRAGADIGRIVDLLRTKNPRVKIFMARIIPLDVAKYGTPFQNAINAINARVATLATMKTTTGSPIVVVDQWTGFAATDFQTDGVHPNESGEKKLATRWFSVLDPLLRAAGSTPCPY